MRIIKVMETYMELTALYKESANSKARRGLFGYMMRTGRTDNTIFGGAFHLVRELETLPKGDVYKLNVASQKGKEIIAVAEVALAGGFDQFAISPRELRRTTKALDRLNIE